MKVLQAVDRRHRLFILILTVLVMPWIIAPDSDPCPACVIYDFYDSLNAGDLDAAMTYVAEEAVLWRPDGSAYQGETEIREQLKREIATTSYQVDDVVDDGRSVSYAWKMVSDGEVLTGTDTAIVEDRQILYSRVKVEGDGS